MPREGRRVVRRAECRADRVPAPTLSPEDVARIIVAIEAGFGLLADTLETGLADIASSIRIQKEEL